MDCSETCSYRNIENEPERIIRLGSKIISFLSDPRVRRGHALIIPRRHIEFEGDLTHDEVLEIHGERVRLQKIVRNEDPGLGFDNWQKYQPSVEEGKPGNVKVSHLHFHFMPRQPEDPLFIPDEDQLGQFSPLPAQERDEVLALYRP